MSKTFRRWHLEQEFLFPNSVRDFVPEGHTAHFVRDLVIEELDLEEILSSYADSRGYPPYHPEMMTALLLYGYTQSVYSSRKIAKACEERVDFMAITAMNKPDFRTIAKFRKRHLSALGNLFVQVLSLCKSANLVSLGHVSLDGTKLKANASKAQSKSYRYLKEEEKSLREEVASWFEKADAIDTEEDTSFGEDKRGDELPEWVSDKSKRLKKIQAARELLESKDKSEREERAQAEKEGSKPKSNQKKRDTPRETRKHNFSDSDSEMLKSSQGFIQGYNAQLAVDSKKHVIVSCHVSTSRNDLNELIPTINQIQENLGELPKEFSADGGYCSEGNLGALQEKGIRGYVCVRTDRNISQNKPYTTQMKLRLLKGGRRSKYRMRKYIVEPVFGVIKSARNFQTFHLRRLHQVNDEWKMVCTAQNLLKLAQLRA